jgi:malate dehydrogenase (oxaloacetate-decarboxylating)(NADP+)
VEIAPAVAKAAMDSGVATRPIADWNAYREKLTQFVFRSGLVMKPLFDRARQDPRRVVYAEGEDERVLRAVQSVIDEGLARPILIGRRQVVQRRVAKLGLRLDIGGDIELVDPDSDPRYNEYWAHYHRLTERKGITPDDARTMVRTITTLIGAMMVKRGEADAMLCGTVGQFHRHLTHINDVIGKAPTVKAFATLTTLILPSGTFFLTDTEVNADPSEEEIAEATILAAEVLRRFGIAPKAALLSHSNFGTAQTESARKMRRALGLIVQRDPELEVEGEMRGDSAVSAEVRQRLFPNSRLKGRANLLVMPSLDAANIALNLLRLLGEGLVIGPILLGAAAPVHVVAPTISVRGIINMTAVAVAESQDRTRHGRA